MATIDKRNDEWRAQVRWKRLGSISRSFISKKDVEKWAKETERAIEAGTFNPTPEAAPSDPKQTTIGQLLERYILFNRCPAKWYLPRINNDLFILKKI